MKVYMSIPVNFPNRDSFFQGIKRTFKNLELSYWYPNVAYSTELISKVNAVIICSDSNLFNFNVNELPSGVQKELRYAAAAGKKLFLAYRPVNSTECGFYEMIFDDISNTVKGVMGTSNSLHIIDREIGEENNPNPLPVPSGLDKERKVVLYDRRLLLK